MSCSYLYEIRRKSDEIEQYLEQDKRENSNLSDYSRDDEIWEVPEESFENVYQQMDGGNEELPQKNAISAMSEEVFKIKQFESTKSLHISLSMEKIALKTPKQQCENSTTKSINNKSIKTETDVKKSLTSSNNTTMTSNTGAANKVQWKNCNLPNKNNNNTSSSTSLLNFTIVPINVATSQGQNQKTVDKPENSTIQKFPEIKLTSFSTRKTSLKPNASKTPTLKPNSGFYVHTSFNDLKSTSNLPRRKSSSGSENIKHITESSTSPESLLDNILSGASSVSVQSSSLSSNGLNCDLVAHKLKQTSKSRDNLVASLALPPNNVARNSGGILKTQIPELKIITAPNSPTNQATPATLNIGTHASPSLLTISNISQSDSFETASNPTRSPSASPLRSLSPRVPSEATLYPDDLRCKICNELFKDPRSLNCLHSFCFQCIVNENFKQDASIPFWSQPQSIQGPHVSSPQNKCDESDFKVLNSPNNSIRSTSPDVQTVLSNSDLSNSPSQQKRRSSFSFKRKKSSDRLALKNKSENLSGAISQQSSHATTQRQPIEMTRLIMCKICNYPTEVPVGGIRQLPQNFLLVRRIEEIRFKVGEEVITRIWCSLCYEETNATYHCLTCILNFCTLCKESHERQKSTTKHIIKNIVDLRRARKEQGSQFIDNSKFILKCSMHPGFDIKSFCTVCLQVACSDCLILLHKGHKYETISKSIYHFGRILKDSTEQTKPLCNYAEHSIAKLNEIAKNINRKCDQIQAEVEEFMNRYFEAVEAHKNTLLQQVVRARESKVEMILEQQMDFEKRTQDALMAVKFSQELIDNASDVEILSFLKILLKRFEYCQQFKAPVDPKISDTLHFLPKLRAPAAKNQNDITLFGIITMQTVEPSLCTLQWDGISQLRLHRKAELVLISRDADGASLCHGGLQIKCQIKYKDNHAKLIPIEISDNRDGSYVISFTPDSQGTIILTITINDKPIKGSPFRFQARTLRPHSGIYHCCTFCSSKGNKSIKCACEGRMPGFTGCGHGHVGHPGRRHWSCCGNVLENSECSEANKLLNS